MNIDSCIESALTVTSKVLVVADLGLLMQRVKKSLNYECLKGESRWIMDPENAPCIYLDDLNAILGLPLRAGGE